MKSITNRFFPFFIFIFVVVPIFGQQNDSIPVSIIKKKTSRLPLHKSIRPKWT
ncbi:hypothetical protein [Maribacter halichondriae]|uniref:hypothetical protein n=1 Tax=Maribacter halichondriae TaxID=2980554 RepID=UPI0023589B67|nr:hypothetical protein [Maribacter sp. Hal144]